MLKPFVYFGLNQFFLVLGFGPSRMFLWAGWEQIMQIPAARFKTSGGKTEEAVPAADNCLIIKFDV